MYERKLASEKPDPRLTPQELDIIFLVAQGLRNKEIAQKIGVTEHVIKNKLRLILDKCGVDNRLALSVWYHDHTKKVNKNDATRSKT